MSKEATCCRNQSRRLCLSTITYRDESLKELTAVLQATKAGFKGLQEDPDSGTETCHWPCNEDQHNEPDEGKARISTHGDSS